MSKIISKPIIPGASWTDGYLLTQQYCIGRTFPAGVLGRYRFINRKPDEFLFPEGFTANLNRQIEMMSEMAPRQKDIEHLKKYWPFLPESYLSSYQSYRFDPGEIKLLRQNGGQLELDIEAPLWRGCLWETPLSSTITGLHSTMWGIELDDECMDRTRQKARLIEKYRLFFSYFACRRSHLPESDYRILQELVSRAGDFIVGASNIHLSADLDLKPIGTMAHFLVQAHAALYGYRNANRMMMSNWLDTYGTNLGTVLPDTFTTPVFLRDFNQVFAQLFSGWRHDSGSAFVEVDRFYNHYVDLGIEPYTKQGIFSNLRSVEEAVEIARFVRNGDWKGENRAVNWKCQDAYGAGGAFAYDILGVPAPNFVIKLTDVFVPGWGWIPVVKLSNNRGKNIGSLDAIEHCKRDLYL